jgi:dolichol-phosphate mannosyltransferase
MAIFIAMCSNFALNRRFSFSHARGGPWPRQFVRFLGASSVGAVINYATTLVVMSRAPGLAPQLAALAGIGVGTLFNFIASRYLVFRTTHVRLNKR